MTAPLKRSEQIRRFILRNVDDHPQDIVRYVTDHFRVSRPAVLRHINTLIKDGVLLATGARKARRYELPVIAEHETVIPLTPDLAEHDVWNEHVTRVIGKVSARAIQICHYGFTEMVNNAIDHSGGDELFVGVRVTPVSITMAVGDNGVGVFRKIKDALGLDDERHAILELAKGKFTTDPKRHSGEGIYFTSRAFDEFILVSGKLALIHLTPGSDWLVDRTREREGTLVEMIIETQSNRSLTEVFKESSAANDPGFSRTRVPVGLAAYGDENLVSRSQAKRLLSRFERFKEIVLDFHNVKTIGQAFADEIFRVFQREHPDVNITAVRTNLDVERMIAHVLADDRKILPPEPRR